MMKGIGNRLNEIIFPCEKIMKELMSEHHIAVQENQEAHKRLVQACSGGDTCQREKSSFPEIKEGKIVNPR